MELDTYKTQMERIRATFGVNHYPQERVMSFWNCFKSYPNYFIEKAVNYFVLNFRRPPLFEDFEKQFRLYELKQNQQRDIQQADDPVKAFDKMVAKTKDVDGDFIKLARKSLTDYLKRKITKSDFKKICDHLDELALQITGSRL